MTMGPSSARTAPAGGAVCDQSNPELGSQQIVVSESGVAHRYGSSTGTVIQRSTFREPWSF